LCGPYRTKCALDGRTLLWNHLTSVTLVSQIILVSVLVYNYSLVLVLTFEGILVLFSVSGLFFCTRLSRHQIFATLPAIKKSLHNIENRTCTIWKCFSVNYEVVLQTTSSSWQQVKNCLVHLQEYTTLQCSCGAVSLPSCEIPTHASFASFVLPLRFTSAGSLLLLL